MVKQYDNEPVYSKCMWKTFHSLRNSDNGDLTEEMLYGISTCRIHSYNFIVYSGISFYRISWIILFLDIYQRTICYRISTYIYCHRILGIYIYRIISTNNLGSRNNTVFKYQWVYSYQTGYQSFITLQCLYVHIIVHAFFMNLNTLYPPHRLVNQFCSIVS